MKQVKIIAFLLFFGVLFFACTNNSGNRQKSKDETTEKPNIVFILVDPDYRSTVVHVFMPRRAMHRVFVSGSKTVRTLGQPRQFVLESRDMFGKCVCGRGAVRRCCCEPVHVLLAASMLLISV